MDIPFWNLTPYEQVWFTSDLHLGHKNIIGFCNRPFRFVNEMNSRLILNINDTVEFNDVLFVVGDACMGQKTDTVPLLAGIKCHVVLVPGNHDPMHPAYKAKQEKREFWLEEYHKHVNEIAPLEVNVSGYRVCHFPYSSDERHGDKYDEFLPVDDGMPLICGHVHDDWRVKGNMFNVGVDVNDYKPVNLNTIKEFI